MTDTHGIARTRIERRVPHFMSRKSRIIRAVKPGRTTCGDNYRMRLDGVKSIVLYPETERAVNPVVVNGKIENVHVVQHLNVRRLRDF